MHPFVKDLLSTKGPKIENLSDEERRYYRFGLSLLGFLIHDDFFDVPSLSDDRFSQTGLFYTIEYFDSDILWRMGNKRMLMVAWDVLAQRSSFCPFNIEMEFIDEKNFKLLFNDNIGLNNRPMTWDILSCEDGKYFTEISNFSNLKFSDLKNYTLRKAKEKGLTDKFEVQGWV